MSSSRQLSFPAQTALMTMAGFFLFGAVVLVISFFVLNDVMMERAQKAIATNIRIAHFVLQRRGNDFSTRDGQLFVGEHVLDGDLAIVDEISSLISGVATIFKGDERVATSVVNEKGKRITGSKLVRGSVYDAVFLEKKGYRGEANIMGEKYFTAYDPLLDTQGNVVGILFVGIKRSERLAIVELMVRNIAFLTCVAGLLFSVLAYRVVRRQMRPLVAFGGVIARLQKGDVSVNIPALDRKDEFGLIASAMQSFKEALIAKQGARAALAAAAEEASTNVQTVASAAEELDASIGEINRQVNNTAQVVGDCVTQAETTTDIMKRLHKSASDIGGIVMLIEDVASRVHLLALNATIEASRAGEAGKGFGVVAHEINNLSDKVAVAAQDIAEQISQIQGQTQQASQTISGITSTVRRVNEFTTTIASAMEEQGAATKEISRSIQEAALGATEVTKSVSDLS